MRKFKFRAWDKISKKMIDLQDLTRSTLDMEAVVFIPLIDAFDVMQCTGLKDKSGKEIYEGDILKHDLDGIFTITYSVYFVGFVAESPGSLAQEPFTPNYLNRCEIIGNVFENPELI